jgi:hypothetical protein
LNGAGILTASSKNDRDPRNSNDESRTFVNFDETVGTPGDAPATDVGAENSAFSLVKGILAALGLPAGTGDSATNTARDVKFDPLATLGSMSDAAATDPDEPNSAIALLKGICVELGL